VKGDFFVPYQAPPGTGLAPQARGPRIGRPYPCRNVLRPPWLRLTGCWRCAYRALSLCQPRAQSRPPRLRATSATAANGPERARRPARGVPTAPRVPPFPRRAGFIQPIP